MEVLEVIAVCGIAIAFLAIVFGFSENSAQQSIKNIRRAQLTWSGWRKEEPEPTVNCNTMK